MNCVVKCHYNLRNFNEIPKTQAKHGKSNQIILDLTDQETRRKLRKCIKHMKGSTPDIKDPIYSGTLKVSVNSKTKYFKGEDQVILSKLVGHEVTARIILKKYTFVSTKKENKGEIIRGIGATLIELKSEF